MQSSILTYRRLRARSGCTSRSCGYISVTGFFQIYGTVIFRPIIVVRTPSQISERMLIVYNVEKSRSRESRVESRESRVESRESRVESRESRVEKIATVFRKLARYEGHSGYKCFFAPRT